MNITALLLPSSPREIHGPLIATSGSRWSRSRSRRNFICDPTVVRLTAMRERTMSPIESPATLTDMTGDAQDVFIIRRYSNE